MMTIRNTFAVWVVAALLLTAGVGTSCADFYLESEQVTKGVPGQPDGKGIIKQYLTSDFTMTDLGDAVTIIDMARKWIYELDPESKTYRRTAVDELGAIPGMGPEAGEMAANPMFQAMVKSMMESFKVTPTDQVKTIAGYKCRKYIVEIMMSTSEYWVTREIEGYDEMKAIGERATAVFANNPLLKQLNIAGMLGSLDGFPVHTVTEMMGGTITTTLKKISRKPLDPAIFAVPAGYRRITD